MSTTPTRQRCARVGLRKKSSEGLLSEPASSISYYPKKAPRLDVDVKISLSRPAALGKRLGCGPGRHKANYRFFELPIRLVRNNPHIEQHLIPIQLALMTL